MGCNQSKLRHHNDGDDANGSTSSFTRVTTRTKQGKHNTNTRRGSAVDAFGDLSPHPASLDSTNGSKIHLSGKNKQKKGEKQTDHESDGIVDIAAGDEGGLDLTHNSALRQTNSGSFARRGSINKANPNHHNASALRHGNYSISAAAGMSVSFAGGGTNNGGGVVGGNVGERSMCESMHFRSCASRFGGTYNNGAMFHSVKGSEYFMSCVTDAAGASHGDDGHHQMVSCCEGVSPSSPVVAVTNSNNNTAPMAPTPLALAALEQQQQQTGADLSKTDDECEEEELVPTHARTNTFAGSCGITASPTSTVVDIHSRRGGTETSATSVHITASHHIRTGSMASTAAPSLSGMTPKRDSFLQSPQQKEQHPIGQQNCASNTNTNSPGTTIYHEQLSALLSEPSRVSDPNDVVDLLSSTDGDDNDSSPSDVGSQAGCCDAPSDGSLWNKKKNHTDGEVVVTSEPFGFATTSSTSTPYIPLKQNVDGKSFHPSHLRAIAQESDPVGQYVKAKLSHKGSQDMSVFRVGCDSISIDKKLDLHLYNASTDPMLLAANEKGAANTTGTSTHMPRSTTTDTSSFSEMLKPTCTWDLIHSIPDAVDKVNNGGLLYRFCAKKFKDLPLEDRVEFGSLINMTGFKDELADNDQPILDFARNKNSVGPTAQSVAAAAAKEAAALKAKKKAADANGKGAKKAAKVDHEMTPAYPETSASDNAETEPIDVDNLLVCVLRLVGIMPRVTSRDANVDCVMNTDFQRLLAAPDEVFEHIDRERTYRKVKHLIPFVFSFRFQMTGCEFVDDDTLQEHTAQHDAKPNRLVLCERTKKHRGTDSTVKSKAWYALYDIPPRGISSLTGKALPQEQLDEQNAQLQAAREEKVRQREAAASASTKGGKNGGKRGDASLASSVNTSSDDPLPEQPGGILCVHTAIIIRTSMPKALAGMVEMLGNRLGGQASGQLFQVRSFLLQKKLEGWSEMTGGGDNPNVSFLWDEGSV